jgi:hypothetical protein
MEEETDREEGTGTKGLGADIREQGRDGERGISRGRGPEPAPGARSGLSRSSLLWLALSTTTMPPWLPMADRCTHYSSLY